MPDQIPHPIAKEILARFVDRTVRSGQCDIRAKKRLPGGDTRAATYFAPYPAYMASGRGCYLHDVDGNTYLDLLNNYTSLIHGHAHPEIMAAAIAQGEKGTVFGAAGEIQIQLAEHLCDRIPAMDQIRCCNSGTEATLFAIRAARAYTGKDGIIKMDGGYHGCHDAVEVNIFSHTEGSSTKRIGPGVPNSVLEDVLVVEFNNLDAVEGLLKSNTDRVAAILVEPLMGAAGAICPQAGYLKGLRTLADRYNVVLIFDEVMTFRLGVGGLQEAEGVQPDLTTLAKIIGGGFPIGAFGGRKEIMSRFDPTHKAPVFHSGTFNGNNITMAAGIAAMELYDLQAVTRLNQLGDRFRDGISAVLKEIGVVGCVSGWGSLLQLHWQERKPVNAMESIAGLTKAGELPRLVHLEMMNRGVYAARRGMFCLSTPMVRADIDKAVAAFKETLMMLKPFIEETTPHLLPD
ncbi:MAG: aspartate aminotransferase family protein [Desulfobacterales bacterium]|jgi:glutamate-1-semialdehyde 2,1-aminomutase